MQLAPLHFCICCWSLCLVLQIFPMHLQEVSITVCQRGSSSALVTRDPGMTPCPFGFPVSKGIGFPNSQAVSCALILDTTAVLKARSQARLLADHRKESGAWLNALPVSTLKLHMDDGLRVATPLCCPP